MNQHYFFINSKKNKNAAPVSGPTSSSHLGGSTVDITKKGLTKDEIRWMRKALLKLEAQDLVEATEEFRQSVFHIMVYKMYTQYVKNKTSK
jgi:hypothetical protein